MKTMYKVCVVVGLMAILGLAVSDALNINMNQGSKKPSPGKKEGTCPPPTTVLGSCVFDPEVNCQNDKACNGKQKCCREGCNKICKDPMKKLELPDLDAWKKWKEQKTELWSQWADETKKIMMDRLADLWDVAQQQ